MLLLRIVASRHYLYKTYFVRIGEPEVNHMKYYLIKLSLSYLVVKTQIKLSLENKELVEAAHTAKENIERTILEIMEKM